MYVLTPAPRFVLSTSFIRYSYVNLLTCIPISDSLHSNYQPAEDIALFILLLSLSRGPSCPTSPRVMYSAHHSPTQELVINRRSSSITQSKPTAPLNGFTWSNNSVTPGARTSSSSIQRDLASTTQNEDQPRTLYSKLYERFIEKREVFVHSNIDVRRSASIQQVSFYDAL